MFISSEKTAEVSRAFAQSAPEIYVNGLYLSSKSFLVDAVADSGIHVILMPDKENAEYFASDIYNIRKSESIYLLPVSGARLEKSARKATCNVQRTAAISAIVDYGKRSSADDKGVIIVTYPEAIEEEFVDKGEVRNSILVLKTGEEISMTGLKEKLLEHGFVKTDYVSVPGEFALRGGIIDVFSFSNNVPYRISLFGDEIESIRLFDTNTRVSIIEDAIAAAGLSNVSVCTYSNLTIDFCREIGVNCIVRGLRTTTDFEFENVIAQANKKIAPEISTIFIPASGEYSFISSTVVRDIILHKGDVSDFLPKGVEIGKYTKNIY